MKSRHLAGTSCLTLAMLLGAPDAAHAQASPPPPAQSDPTMSSPQTAPAASSDAATQSTAPTNDQGGLAEIVVTAQRRSENIQNVPIAITAVTGQALQAKGLTDIASIGGQAPNVTLRSSASFGGSSSILVSYIRGIGQNDFAFNLEPGVGIYIDGVYLGRNIGANADLLDLDRVEVLKGPQGTLFGRNSVGGALNIVTRDPGNVFKVRGEATTGSYNRIDVRAAIEAPLVKDKLSLGIAFSTKHRDGWQKRIPYTGDTANNPIYLLATGGAFGGPPNTNTDESSLYPITRQDNNTTSGGQNQTTVRAKLLWKPTDRLRIRLTGDYQHVDQSASPFTLIKTDQQLYVALYNTCITGNPAIYAGVGALTGLGAGVANLCTTVRGNPASPTGTQPPLGSQAGLHLPYDNRYIIRNADGSINPDVSYASGANYDKLNNYGLTGQIEYDLTNSLQMKSITAYRHLNSAFGVDIGGAPFAALNPTFADRESQFSQELQLTGKVLDGRWNFVLGGFFFHESGSHDDGVPFTGGLIQVYSPNNTYDTKSYSAYLHNNISIIPDLLGVTLGIRYTHEDKSFTGAQRDENAFVYKLGLVPLAGFPGGDPYRLYPLGKNFLKFNNLSYRVGAELHAARNIMIYASYATGYKGGGWTTRLLFPSFVAPTFGPEKARTAEIGVKTKLFDNKVRLNIAGFHTNYDNIQLTFQQGVSPVTANGGNGKIDGFEAELNAALTRAWSLDASVGYLKTRYSSILPGVVLTLNDVFVNSPKWTAQAGTSYRFDLGSAGSFTPRVDWTYASRSYNDEVNTPELATIPHSTFNASLTYALPDSRFEIQAGVTNFTDKRFIVSGYTNAQAIYAATYNAPREWFLTLRVRN